MPSRTQIVCLHEGKAGRSIDPIFINSLLKALDPPWLRPWPGSNVIRPKDCGGRSTLMERMPTELKTCLQMGGHTTLMVWADLDHDAATGDELKERFWIVAQQRGITKEEFDQVVFVFAKDRLENWIEFLQTNVTDEGRESPRIKNGKMAADAAKKLARRCREQATEPANPPSLQWSCKNWHSLVNRMRQQQS